MTLHRTVRQLALLGLLVVASSGVLAQLSLVPPALATTPTGQQLTAVPIRWCVMKGTTPDVDPAALNEPDTDSVMWRRHERASDRIWIPQAGITFRSAITWNVLTNDSFPVIDDPDTSNPIGNPGDVVNPEKDNGEEFLKVKHKCEEAWRAKTWLVGTPVVGITGVSIGKFFNPDGSTTTLRGWGSSARFTGNHCTAPGDISITEAGGFAVVDAKTAGTVLMGNDYRGDTRLVAHEIGHTLGLEHGDGIDNNNNGRFDGYPSPPASTPSGCDGSEPERGTFPGTTTLAPFSLMNRSSTTSETGITRNRPNNQDQLTRASAFASKLSGGQKDPPGVLVPGPTLGDRAIDPYEDVGAKSVDVLSVGLAFNPLAETVFLSQELFGLIPDQETNQYLMFLDLDADPTSGGRPDELGFSTAFEGAEVVTRVVVSDGAPTPTVWQFDGSSFVEVDPSVEGIIARIQRPLGGETAIEINDIVTLELPMHLTGVPKPTIRFQAVAEQMGPGSELDIVPGGLGEPPGPGSDTVFIVPPEFPVCGADPGQVDPGDSVSVEASGFRRAGEGVHVILGDELVAQGTLDNTGTVVVDFVVPSNARTGLRLITIGVDDSALTADCSVQVGPIEEDVPDDKAQDSVDATPAVIDATPQP